MEKRTIIKNFIKDFLDHEKLQDNCPTYSDSNIIDAFPGYFRFKIKKNLLVPTSLSALKCNQICEMLMISNDVAEKLIIKYFNKRWKKEKL